MSAAYETGKRNVFVRVIRIALIDLFFWVFC
jgi:hypothetical protein